MNDRKILIDALCRSENPIYLSTPESIRENIINGIPPFNQIDLVLITHRHSDHFDGLSIGRFIEQNPDSIVISTHEVIAELKKYMTDKKNSKLVAVKSGLRHAQEIIVNGIRILAFPTIHDGKEYEQTSHLAYLVDYGARVFHTGDSSPVSRNYELNDLKPENINLLIATFPYVGLPSAREIVKKYIKPEKIAIVHLPVPEMDEYGWIKSTKKNYERVRNNFIRTLFLEKPEDSILF